MLSQIQNFCYHSTQKCSSFPKKTELFLATQRTVPCDIDYIIPKLTVLSIVCLILGIAYGLRIYVFGDVTHFLIELATILLPTGILFWYAMIQHKVSKLFW